MTSVLGRTAGPVHPHSRARAHQRDRPVPRSQKLMTWSADFPADDWTKIIADPGLYARAAAHRGQRQGHPAAARHPAAHRRGAAHPAARIEAPRLSHRPCRAGDTRPAQDRDAREPVGRAHHMRQIWPASFVEADETIALPAPSPANFGATHPFDAFGRRCRPPCAATSCSAPASRPNGRPRLGRALSAKPRRRSPARCCRRPVR